MRSRTILVCLVLAVGVSHGAMARELVDRVVAIVDRDVVTLSEAEQAIALRELRGSETPTLEDVVERLIEERLIEREVARFAGEGVPDDDVEQTLSLVAARFASREAFEMSLSEHGLDTAALRKIIRSQLQINRYLDRRFRALTQVAADEIERYYDDEIRPQLSEARDVTDSEREQIRRLLEEKKFNDRVDAWIDALKARAHIRRYVW